MPIVAFSNLGQSFGAVDIFAGLTASVPHGAKIGLIGPNGVGKTTLLRILVGAAQLTTGDVHIARGTRVGYLQQEAVDAFVERENTVYGEMLAVFTRVRAMEARLRRMEGEMARGNVSEALLEAYGTLQETFELAGGYDYEVRIRQVLTGLGFQGEQQRMPLRHCSGGQKTRALLARLLLERPDLLILDEPTNHLDAAAVEWLEGVLHTWEGAILLVSHDRYFLDRVVDTIWEMTRGGIETYRGNYTACVQQREERWERREKELAAVQEHFLKELDYVKRNIARASTSDQAKGRMRRLVRGVKAVELGGPQALNGSWLQFTEEVAVSREKWNVAEVERHIKALPSANPSAQRVRVDLQARVRGGNIVLRTQGLRVGYPGVPLFEAQDVMLLRGERVALIGANGTGKSTFLRTLLGEVDVLGGSISLGANVQVSYFSQAYEVLDPDHAVLDELLAHREMPVGQARDYLARYLFRGDDVFKLVRALSGGERSRLALAILSLQEGNLLLLDEPTNHLDIPSCEALQEALRQFEGTILLVSHDRYLIDKLATQVWELRDGRMHVHQGNYASFLAVRQEVQSVGMVVEPQSRGDGRCQSTAHQQDVVQHLEQVEDAAHVEALVDEVEAALARLGRDLVAATQAQRWERVRSLTHEYEATQARLDGLMAQWEATAG